MPFDQAQRVKVRIIRQGLRYGVGYGPQCCAVWDLSRPDHEEVGRWPRSDAGWTAACAHFDFLEAEWRTRAAPMTTARPAPESSLVPARIRRASEHRLIVAGGLLLAIAPFLPWLNLPELGNVDLFAPQVTSGGARALAWLLVALGIGLALVAFGGRDLAKLAVAAVAAATALVLIGGHFVIETMGLAGQGGVGAGVGLLVAAVAAGALSVGAIVAQRADRSTRP